jgi:hypothetical protein
LASPARRSTTSSATRTQKRAGRGQALPSRFAAATASPLHDAVLNRREGGTPSRRPLGYKVRYRGVAKNTAQLFTLFAVSNMWVARRQLLRPGDECVRSAPSAREAASNHLAERPSELETTPRMPCLCFMLDQWPSRCAFCRPSLTIRQERPSASRSFTTAPSHRSSDSLPERSWPESAGSNPFQEVNPSGCSPGRPARWQHGHAGRAPSLGVNDRMARPPAALIRFRSVRRSPRHHQPRCRGTCRPPYSRGVHREGVSLSFMARYSSRSVSWS